LDADITPQHYVGDLVALIQSLGDAPVHYCGESVAGIIGMALAAEHPDLLRTLSLVAAPTHINPDTQKALAFGYPTWQEALSTLGSRGWADAANSATRFGPGTDSSYHAIMNIMPAMLARQVLYFAAQHDGTVCDEA
jgi:pimeloyl-ACP methyl ester carboxylesterase